MAAITGPVGLVTAAILGAASALAIFKANSDAIVNERISEQAQKYISSGKSIDELKQMREEALAKNLEYYGKQERARDATNPLKADNLPYFVASYRENRKNLFAYGAQTQYYYEQVKALDEAISVLSQTTDTTGLTVEDFSKVIQGSNTEIEKSTGLIGQLEQKINELETAKKEATSTMEIHNVTLEIATLRDELSKLQQMAPPNPSRAIRAISSEKAGSLPWRSIRMRSIRLQRSGRRPGSDLRPTFRVSSPRRRTRC